MPVSLGVDGGNAALIGVPDQRGSQGLVIDQRSHATIAIVKEREPRAERVRDALQPLCPIGKCNVRQRSAASQRVDIGSVLIIDPDRTCPLAQWNENSLQ